MWKTFATWKSGSKIVMEIFQFEILMEFSAGQCLKEEIEKTPTITDRYQYSHFKSCCKIGKISSSKVFQQKKKYFIEISSDVDQRRVYNVLCLV